MLPFAYGLKVHTDVKLIPKTQRVELRNYPSTTTYKFTGELLTPKDMSFGDTNTSSLFLLLPATAF